MKQGIMTANRRNYYRECAAYIAVLGEVQESLGEKDAKQRLMASYNREIFPEKCIPGRDEKLRLEGLQKEVNFLKGQEGVRNCYEKI